MGIETTTNFAGLDESWPLSTDPTNEGAAHYRVIKDAIKTVFPGAGAQGFAIPITATEAELNFVDGVTSSIQDQLDALANAIGGVDGVLTAPTDTVMLFFQAAAPDGWVINPFLNNRMIRVVSSYAGGGGSDNPVSFTHAHGTQATSLSVSQMPQHYHSMSGGADGDIFASGGSGSNVNGGPFAMGNTAYTGSGAAHTHGNTLTSSWSPLYQDAISCIKS